MPHESTVEHTGELFEPTESSAFAPRGFSFSEDTPCNLLQRELSTGSNTSGSVVPCIPHRCDDDDDDDDSQEVDKGEPAQDPLETVHEEKTGV